MAVRVAPGMGVMVGDAVGVGVTGVPLGTGLGVAEGTTATTMTGVGRGVTVAEGSGLALWARATVRAVMRSIRPTSDRPTMTYRLQRRADVENVWLADLLDTDIPTHVSQRAPGVATGLAHGTRMA